MPDPIIPNQDPNPQAQAAGEEGTVRTTVPDGQTVPPTPSAEPSVATKVEEPTGQKGSLLGGDPPVATPKPWLTSLPKEMRDDPNAVSVLNGFEGPNEVIKKYLENRNTPAASNLGELMSAASQEDKSSFRKLLGVPEDAAGYLLASKLPPQAQSENMMQGFRTKAKELELSQSQASDLLDFYDNAMVTAVNSKRNAMVEEFRVSDQQIRQEWGEQYPTKMAEANRAIDKHGGQPFRDFLNTMIIVDSQGKQTQLGNHPMMARVFSSIGTTMGEDTFESVEETPEPQRTPGRFQYKSMED